MKLHHGMVVVSLLLALGAGHSSAAPVSYTINFTTASGIAPASGSFEYDASTSLFTDFAVVWEGTTYDLTSHANVADYPASWSFDPCFAPAPGYSAALFLLLTSCSSGGRWWAEPYTDLATGGHDYGFGFGWAAEVGLLHVIAQDGVDRTQLGDYGNGTFLAVPTGGPAVPEPGSCGLALIGVGLVVRARRSLSSHH